MDNEVEKINHVYLKIGSAVIKLCFHKSEFYYEDVIGQIEAIYKGFIVENIDIKSDFTIHFSHINQLDIFSSKGNETYSYIYRQSSSKNIYTHYQINTYQFQYILRRALLEVSSIKKMLIIHGSAVLIGKRAIVFLGISGAGKSTAMKLLNKKYRSLADDSLIIAIENGKFYFYQTPYFEKELWIKRNNKRYLLKGIYFLKKSKDFKITKVENYELLISKLMKQVTTNPGFSEKHSKIAIKFASEYNNFYYLYFDKKQKELIKLIESS